MSDTTGPLELEDFGWDEANQRFRTPDRCPYPDCGQPVDPTNTPNKSTLSWCPSCQRPYEAHRITTFKAPFEVNRRPHTAFATETGEVLSGPSLLDWAEAGGNGGRTNSIDDDRGVIFGPPESRYRITLRPGWEQSSLMASTDPEDHVRSVSVVCGQVVAVTARGRIGTFDAVTGEKSAQRHLEWPDGSTDPGLMERSVSQAPAFRGTRMVLAAAHQVLFRDLRFMLFGGKVETRHRLVEAAHGNQFLGPPLMVDSAKGSLCCLLEGRPREGAIQSPLLRFFSLEGEEVVAMEPGELVRPPVFAASGGHLVWLDKRGSVAWLHVDEITGESKPVPRISMPSTLLRLEPDDRPSLIAAPDGNRRTELWVSSTDDGHVVLYKCLIEDVQGRSSWAWQARDLSKLGPLSGVAIGIGSRSRNNAAEQLLAVATTEKVSLFQRYSDINSAHAMQGLEIGGSRGSYDPPLVCSAGVVARLQGKIAIDNQGIGWDDSVLHPSTPVPGIYDKPQGIAMFGRQVFIGHGLGVRSYSLVKELRPE